MALLEFRQTDGEAKDPCCGTPQTCGPTNRNVSKISKGPQRSDHSVWEEPRLPAGGTGGASVASLIIRLAVGVSSPSTRRGCLRRWRDGEVVEACAPPCKSLGDDTKPRAFLQAGVDDCLHHGRPDEHVEVSPSKRTPTAAPSSGENQVVPIVVSSPLRVLTITQVA